MDFFLAGEHLRCVSCRTDIFDDGYLCPDCQEKLPFISKGNYCRHCGRKTAIMTNYCDTCKNVLTNIDLGRSVFSYEDDIVRLVTGYKFRDNRYLKTFFATEMCKKVKDADITADLITYVPMTDKAKKQRGFNQSEYLARELSKRLGLPLLSVLEKVKETHKQVGLSRNERLKNLEDAFKVTDKKLVDGKCVLIVDDVTTTGATAEVLATRLKKAGAKQVFLISIASVGDIKKEGDSNGIN